MCGPDSWEQESIARAPRRSWVWWLSVLGAAAWITAAIWISYRALMGWPVPGIGLLSRLGG